MLGPRTMRRLARFNKRVTNPIQLLWATRFSHYSVLEHVGRKSGTPDTYALTGTLTPVHAPNP
ncbi:hypothetical protein GCM10027167_39760 [Nocardia heshunensis]